MDAYETNSKFEIDYTQVESALSMPVFVDPTTRACYNDNFAISELEKAEKALWKESTVKISNQTVIPENSLYKESVRKLVQQLRYGIDIFTHKQLLELPMRARYDVINSMWMKANIFEGTAQWWFEEIKPKYEYLCQMENSDVVSEEIWAEIIRALRMRIVDKSKYYHPIEGLFMPATHWKEILNIQNKIALHTDFKLRKREMENGLLWGSTVIEAKKRPKEIQIFLESK